MPARSPAVLPTLRDDADEAQFRDRGYVVVDWIDPAVVESLLDLAAHLHTGPPPTSPWACDFYSEDPEQKRQVREAISEAFRAPVARRFTDHETFLHAFVANWPGRGGGLELHQHSSVVEEPTCRSAVVWCALTETTSASGTLHVIPGSHLVRPGPKAERSADWFKADEERLIDEHAVAVSLRPGQALVFDNALLHLSDENRSTAPRVTAVANLAPRSAELRYYSMTDTGEIEVYRLDPEFFLGAVSEDFEWARPDGLELLETRPADVWVPNSDELSRLLPPRTPRRSRRGLPRLLRR